MADVDPILIVLAYSSLAALAGVLGVIPEAVHGRLPRPLLGWSNALASGLMLGVAYTLLTQGLSEAALLQGGLGALLGLGLVYLSHATTGTEDLDLNARDEMSSKYGHQVFLISVLHGAHEGVAIGAAMAVSLPFGISMVLALAVHNIPEAMVFTTILRARGVRLIPAAGLAVISKLNQVLVAVVTFSVLGALPALLPWAIGFAVGALIYLVLVELLPESYRQAGHTSIALVSLVALGIVVALGGAP